jgi:isocitrate lyase
MEPKITIELTAQEIQNLGILLDAAVKATGIQGGKIAVPIIEKLETVVAAHNAANAPAEVKEAA